MTFPEWSLAIGCLVLFLFLAREIILELEYRNHHRIVNAVKAAHFGPGSQMAFHNEVVEELNRRQDLDEVDWTDLSADALYKRQILYDEICAEKGRLNGPGGA